MSWTPEVWASAEFLTEIRDWAGGVIGDIRAMDRVKERPWAAVWRVESAAGIHYLKQNCPGQQHEARIVDVLARIDPDRVVTPVAVDTDRDLLLTADQGPTFRSHAARDVEGWVRLLREAMLLARATAAHLDELALTTVDPAGAAAHVRRAREDWEIPEEFRAGVDRAVQQTARAGEQLASLGLPLTLVHNDLHDDNAFVQGDRVRFFDFGDAVASSPLVGLRIPLAAYARSIEAEEDDPRVLRLADSALEVWSDLAPLAALRAALGSAHRLAAVTRAESWHRIFAAMPVASIPEPYRGADADWLAEAGE